MLLLLPMILPPVTIAGWDDADEESSLDDDPNDESSSDDDADDESISYNYASFLCFLEQMKTMSSALMM